MAIGEGFGAAGTRVTKRLGLDDEVLAYILQGIVGAVASDLFLAGALFSYYLIGWWAIVLLLSLTGLMVSVVLLLAVGRIVGVPEQGGAWYRVLVGNLWGIGALLGLAYGQGWYETFREGIGALGEAFAEAFAHPWYVYSGIAALLLLVAVKVHWRVALIAAALAAAAALAFLPGAYLWGEVWENLKYVLLPFAWPAMVFAGLIALVMGKEILFPSLEWTMKPIELTELREIGLVGLWLPGLFPRQSTPKNIVKVSLGDLLASLEADVRDDDGLD